MSWQAASDVDVTGRLVSAVVGCEDGITGKERGPRRDL